MLSKDFPSPLYSELGIEYQQAYDGPYEDLSFSVNGTTVIAANKDGKITGFGRPVFATGKKLRQAAERLYKISDDIWYRAYEIDDFAKFLLEKGYEATPYYTQVIDLYIKSIRPKTEQELHTDIRKSYKSLLNKGDFRVLQDSLDSQDWCLFVDIHRIAAGCQTRTRETWRIQFRQIIQKEAFLVISGFAGGLFIYNNHTCYYGVGASLEGANSHALIWKAILHAKELGCKFFEMGEQVFSGDKKLMGISRFKAGFGGRTEMRLDLRKKE